VKKPSYKALQRSIARDDKHSIESRWLYGQTIINDPKKMAPSGKSLRNGAIEALMADAVAVGSAVSRREIQWRIQCARAYKTIIELRTASSQFEDWTALREAGFPAVDVDEPQSPDSLLNAIESGPRPDPQEFEQLGMFPEMVKDIPLAASTLRHLTTYAEEMKAMTASFARRDEEREQHLRELTAATGGDLDVLYPDAVAALGAVTA
jgi:hypothetical protein